MNDEDLERMMSEAGFTRRACGECSLCCKVLDVKEIGKPAGQWCPDCMKPGCRLHGDGKPEICKHWHCLWALGMLPEWWWPKHSHIVPHFQDNKTGDGATLWFSVDRHYPENWRKEPYYSGIRMMSRLGLTDGFRGMRYQTLVVVGEQTWVVLPNKEQEFHHKDGVTLMVGPEEWHFMETKEGVSAEQAMEWLNRYAETMRRLHPLDKLRHIDEMAAEAKDEKTIERFESARAYVLKELAALAMET